MLTGSSDRIHHLVFSRYVTVSLVVVCCMASHISAEQYYEEFEKGKRQFWMSSCMPICPENGSFEPLHKEHQNPAAKTNLLRKNQKPVQSANLSFFIM